MFNKGPFTDIFEIDQFISFKTSHTFKQLCSSCIRNKNKSGTTLPLQPHDKTLLIDPYLSCDILKI